MNAIDMTPTKTHLPIVELISVLIIRVFDGVVHNNSVDINVVYHIAASSICRACMTISPQNVDAYI